MALAVLPAVTSAQQPGPAGLSPLIVDPQRGATPSLPTPSPAATPARSIATPARPQPSPVLPTATPSPRPASAVRQGTERTSGGFALPPAVDVPMAIDPASDPLLAFARSSGAARPFRAAMAAALARHPARDEMLAGADEALAARNEARARMNPSVDLSLSYFNMIAREFSNDPLNVLERSRPRYRTDGLVTVQQPLIDFGANRDRVHAADARLAAARAGVVDMDSQLALRAVAAWTAVFTNRVAVELAGALVADQRGLRRALDERIARGYAAPADAAQLDGYVAAAAAQLADLRRGLAGAEAQYAELVGSPAPPGLARVPDLVPGGGTEAGNGREDGAIEDLPSVTAARALAEAARRDAGSARAANLPQVGLSLTAGRYGIVETARDYDVRGAASLSWRLFGGAKQRADQAAARARSAEARYRRTREEARRDAAIARADVDALIAAEAAIAEDYLSSRRARDAVAARFRVSRGTLFDVAVANSNYFGVAIRYLRTLGELDTARYALLARTNRLLDALQITADRMP